jgi:hypothetical protein
LLPAFTLAAPTGQKSAVVVGPATVEWRMVWINSRNARNLAIRVDDPMPVNQSYVSATLACTPRGSTVVASCAYNAASARIVVDATLGPDAGNLDENTAANELVVTFRTTYTGTTATNVATANWDANGSGSVTDDIAQGQTPVTVTATVGPIVNTIPTTSREALLALALLVAVLGAGAVRRPGSPTARR